MWRIDQSRTLGAAMTIGVLMAGCGGGEGDGVRGQASRQEVNAACLAANKETAAKLERAYRRAKAKRIESEKEGIRFEVSVLVPTLIEGARSEIEAIGSLDVSDGGEDRLRRILGAYRTWIKKAESTPLKVVVANDVYNQGRELADDLGLAECSVSPFEVPAAG